MAAVRTMEDFIRQRMATDGGKRLSIVRRSDGQFEASIVHRDGSTATVDVADDPAVALWNALVPFAMRRRAPSGREVVGDFQTPAAPIPLIDLDDLLGDVAPAAPSLDDLLA